MGVTICFNDVTDEYCYWSIFKLTSVARMLQMDTVTGLSVS